MQVLDNISKKGYLNLNEVDLKLIENRNEVHWRHNLAIIRKKLVAEDYINNTEKNNWGITKEGKSYLISLCEEISNSEISELKKLSNIGTEKAKTYLKNFRNVEEDDLFIKKLHLLY